MATSETVSDETFLRAAIERGGLESQQGLLSTIMASNCSWDRQLSGRYEVKRDSCESDACRAHPLAASWKLIAPACWGGGGARQHG